MENILSSTKWLNTGTYFIWKSFNLKVLTTKLSRFSGKGNSSQLVVALSTHTENQIIENIQAAVKAIAISVHRVCSLAIK